MKSTILLLLLIPFAHFLQAQDGIFMTYEDFLANKVIPADGNSMTYNYGKKIAKAMMKYKGEKKEYKLADIWGFREGEDVFRSTHSEEKDPLAKVLMVGNYVYYAFEINVPHAGLASGGMGYGNGSSAHYYISKDLTSPVYFFTAHLETMDEIIAAHPEFKDLKAPFSKAGKGHRSEQVLMEFIKKSKEYKPLPKAFPLLKLDPDYYK